MGLKYLAKRYGIKDVIKIIPKHQILIILQCPFFQFFF